MQCLGTGGQYDTVMSEGEFIEYHVSVQSVRSYFEISTEQKLESATKRKNLGNGLFEKGLMKEALTKYDYASSLIDYLFGKLNIFSL
jgi:hypothetical protein